MTQPAYKYYSYAEYLAMEEASTERHEYFRGEIFVMSGGTSPHNRVAINIATCLNTALQTHPCFVYSSDMRIRIDTADFSTYADVMVICGEEQFYQDRLDVVTNPLLVVEVLSPSTSKFDQTKKFELYRYLPSFAHYLIVDPDRAYIEYYAKTGENWLLRLYTNLDQIIKITLPHSEVELPLATVYQKINFPPPTPLKPRSKQSKKK
jgi:Uma2 family endonuclease